MSLAILPVMRKKEFRPMNIASERLPQVGGQLFLTDGGLETTLIFHDKVELPYFAAFDLMRSQDGKNLLRRYYERYIAIAKSNRVGFILESPTWRASPDWGAKLGYSAAALAEINRESIELMADLRAAHATADTPMVISGCIGPRGDGYDPGTVMSAAEAEDYHAFQARVFAQAGADMIAAITMTNSNEAIGITRAAQAGNLPAAISFTLETDGRLPTGQDLADAIAEVDAATGGGPAYYMINCAHPTHFAHTLAEGSPWLTRLRGVRANASRRSHAELNDSPDLDAGNPEELGRQYRALTERHPHITILGGCCGTDHRHLKQIGAAVHSTTA
jgi:S-methylmethionine-dependent homocysteine/selenocysteine methylase